MSNWDETQLKSKAVEKALEGLDCESHYVPYYQPEGEIRIETDAANWGAMKRLAEYFGTDNINFGVEDTNTNSTGSEDMKVVIRIRGITKGLS